VSTRGDPHDAAEGVYGGGDPLVIGGDHDGVHTARFGGSTIHVLDHRTAGDIGEGLARQAARGVSGGDDGDDGERL
jgi:hypothetical protein